MSNNQEQRPEFEMIESGDIVQNKKGKQTVVATFDDGHLEFASEQFDKKYREQVQRCVEQDTEGVVTGKRVESYGIKGRERDEISPKEPPRPNADRNLGDKTPAVVKWFFKWRPQEAYVRYRVELDSEGSPVIAHCRRSETRIGENPKDGTVQQKEVITESETGIIALRATELTFLRAEIVGTDLNEVPVEEQV